jgi:class 3 adenylate cyclase
MKTVADAALEMLKVTDSLRFGTELLAVRIGIDTGPAVAGVIVTSKFSYDLWGDSVDTASRMESHGESGRIHVTSAVRDGLVETHRSSERGIIQIRSRGKMMTWYLEGPIE